MSRQVQPGADSDRCQLFTTTNCCRCLFRSLVSLHFCFLPKCLLCFRFFGGFFCFFCSFWKDALSSPGGSLALLFERRNYAPFSSHTSAIPHSRGQSMYHYRRLGEMCYAMKYLTRVCVSLPPADTKVFNKHLVQQDASARGECTSVL